MTYDVIPFLACENYKLLSSPKLDQNIIGGVPAALGEFPHMVNIVLHSVVFCQKWPFIQTGYRSYE